MINGLFYAFILTLLPLTELRAGLPLAIFYSLKNGIPVWLVFVDIILINILLIFIIFFFLDKFHNNLLKIKVYEKLFKNYILFLRKKSERIKKSKNGKFIALLFLVAIPLPGTGAYTGCLISWLLGLERNKSILFISVGILLAGIFVLLASLGIFKFII